MTAPVIFRSCACRSSAAARTLSLAFRAMIILACGEPFRAITKSLEEGVAEEEDGLDEEEEEFSGFVLLDGEPLPSPPVVSSVPDALSSPSVVPVSL